MDFTIGNAIEELKKNFKNQENAFDSMDMERCLREFKTELYIKREEVRQLRNDLEAAHLEIRDLKKALDGTNKSYDEKTFNLNVLMNKCGKMEIELQEKRESLMSLQMQDKMTEKEIQILNDKLQESESERLELGRKLENFEAKKRHDFIYHNAILKRENNLRGVIGEVNEMMMKLKKEHEETMKLSEQTKFAEDAMEKLQNLSKNYEKLKEQKENFEELYIKTNAKYEKLKELMAVRSELHEPNLVTKIIFSHWKDNRARYDRKIKETNEILTKLTESYTSEKTSNVKLIHRNEELNELVENSKGQIEDLMNENRSLKESHLNEVEGLKNKIKELEEQIKLKFSEVIEIKNESIEIVE